MGPSSAVLVAFTFIFNTINNVSAQNCPVFNDSDSSWSQVLQSIQAIFSDSRYNTSELQFYVMTPSSYPHFVNPDGSNYDWSTSECAGRPILFNCHGWLTRGNETWVYDLLGTFVNQFRGCGVASDYSGATLNYNYFETACETKNIATGLSAYINDNICPITDCSTKLYLHGLSLGAHPCGVAGYLLKQKGVIVPRIITSDAAGPAFNLVDVNDGSLHLSKDSAAIVINLKTSVFQGSSLAGWVHQQQIIGSCDFEQNQCPSSDQGCSHRISAYITRSTMEPSYPDKKLKQLDNSTSYNCSDPIYTDVEDSLGWKSEGKPGEFKIGQLEGCLDSFHPSIQSSNRKTNKGKKNRQRKNKISHKKSKIVELLHKMVNMTKSLLSKSHLWTYK